MKELLTFVIFLIALPALAQSTEYVVGDYAGWTLNFNYTVWAEGKNFIVGDTLVFKYPVGKHNVFKVDGPTFKACSVPPYHEALTTGYDVIKLATPGRKWYLCGVNKGKHCKMGMKLFINVTPASSPVPAASPPSTWTSLSPYPATISGPTKHIVGDDKGWTLNFDYNAWAKDKVFQVGDSLVFKYPKGKHNVFKVDGPTFQACYVPSAKEALTTGYDVITLATPGRKWYLCGVNNGKHCQMGMKLFINVMPTSSPVPAPSPIPSPKYLAPSNWQYSPASSPVAVIGPTKHIVGDDKGWTLNFDYKTWAQGKEFHVGDTLVFKYPPGKHNVYKVDGPTFNACIVPSEVEALTTGYDVITLATPGRKWYICGVNYGKHCMMGMKLFIEVLPATSPAPAATPSY